MSGLCGHRLDLLNDYTKIVLSVAAEIESNLPHGWDVRVNASSHLTFTHVGGEWITLEMRGLNPDKRRWLPFSGSLYDGAREFTNPLDVLSQVQPLAASEKNSEDLRD